MKVNQERGQSTIEFILTFMFALGIVFLFVNIAVNYSVGYLTHYATFMAARTYLVVDSGLNDPNASHNEAQRQALETFRRFKMQQLGIPAGGVLPGNDNSDPGFHINPYNTVTTSADALMVGAYAVFEKPISFFGVIGGSEKSKFVSEAYLGKEPVRAECFQRTCAAIKLGIGVGANTCDGELNDFTVYDNGC